MQMIFLRYFNYILYSHENDMMYHHENKLGAIMQMIFKQHENTLNSIMKMIQ